MNYSSNWLPLECPTPTAEECTAEYARRGLEYRKATLFLLAIGLIVPFKASCLSLYRELSIDVIEMEIMPDHVHLLMEVDPQFGIHKAVKQIKGRTSRILRQEFSWLRSRLPSLWTNSYFVSTVGGAPLSVIKQYIENQKNV